MAGSLNPLVSVVVPTYNRADYVAETLESVLQQTYDNFEIIVIDDGSTDNTREVVQRFAPRVRYVWQKNSERGASRNHGLRLAAGEFIAFLDSDDLWLPEMVQQCVAFLMTKPSVGLVYTDAMQIDAQGKDVRILRASGPSGRVTDRLLTENFLSIGRHLIRTELVRDIGGFREDRRLSGSEDWEMWVRLSLRAEIAHLPVITTKIRMHPANTMADPAAMQRSMARAIELLRAFDELSPRQKRKLTRMEANMALINAINHCSSKQARKALRFLKNAAATDARTILDPRFAYTVLRLVGGLRQKA